MTTLPGGESQRLPCALAKRYGGHTVHHPWLGLSTLTPVTKDLADFRKVFEAEARKKPKEIVLFVLRGTKDTQLVRIETRWAAAPEKPKAEPPPEKKPEGAGEAKPEAAK